MIVRGETGAVVEAGDYASLRDAIRTYLADPTLAESHAKAGLSHVRSTFPLEKEATSLGEVYEALRRG